MYRVEARVKKRVVPHDEIGLDCGKYALGDPLTVEVCILSFFFVCHFELCFR
jgi:hypothetical protein